MDARPVVLAVIALGISTLAFADPQAVEIVGLKIPTDHGLVEVPLPKSLPQASAERTRALRAHVLAAGVPTDQVPRAMTSLEEMVEHTSNPDMIHAFSGRTLFGLVEVRKTHPTARIKVQGILPYDTGPITRYTVSVVETGADGKEVVLYKKDGVSAWLDESYVPSSFYEGLFDVVERYLKTQKGNGYDLAEEYKKYSGPRAAPRPGSKDPGLPSAVSSIAEEQASATRALLRSKEPNQSGPTESSRDRKKEIRGTEPSGLSGTKTKPKAGPLQDH